MKDFWFGIRALATRLRGGKIELVCIPCVNSNEKVGRRTLAGAVCCEDEGIYHCDVCGNVIRDCTENEKFARDMLGRIKEMDRPLTELFSKSVRLITDEGMDAETAFRKTGFLQILREETEARREG